MKKCRLKNLVSFGIIFSSVGWSCVADALLSSQPSSPPVLVAITQIVPHPSLDLIRQGIEDELKERGIVCDTLFENAQGNMATATQIAQKFISQNPAVIVPITTPSTQTVYAVTKASGKNIPVVFAAVNDPVAAKLAPSMDKSGDGITGLSDLPPVADQVAFIQEILPPIKKLGVIYNPGESNSVALLQLLEKACTQNGIILFRATAANMVDVGAAAKSLIGKVEAIYIPNDNTVVAALEALLKVARDNRVPVFCADPESVKQGCLGTVAHSQYGLGRQTGKMVAKVLNGVDVEALPIETPAEVEMSLNQDTANALNVTFPETVVKRAKHVIKK